MTELVWETTHECDRSRTAATPATTEPPSSARTRSTSAGCFWSGTRPTWTWAWGRSWADVPTAAHRPRFDALGRWLLGRTAEISVGEPPADISVEPEATVFTNIAPGSADVVRPWVEALRNVGFAVFAKPKVDEDSDVDSDMLGHIALRRSEGSRGTAGGFRGRPGLPAAPGGDRARRVSASRYSDFANMPAGR